MEMIHSKIEQYSKDVTTSTPELLQELLKATYANIENPQMATGPLEGRFLKLMVQLTGAKKVLEVGMFTGYGTLSMAEGLPEDGKIFSCEFVDQNIEFAQKFFQKSPHGKKIEILKGPALHSMKKLDSNFDLIFVDADKEEYPDYYEESLRLLRKGGCALFDNMLRGGSVLDPQDDAAKAIDQVNRKASKDSRVECVLLTIRDGVLLFRKK